MKINVEFLDGFIRDSDIFEKVCDLYNQTEKKARSLNAKYKETSLLKFSDYIHLLSIVLVHYLKNNLDLYCITLDDQQNKKSGYTISFSYCENLIHLKYSRYNIISQDIFRCFQNKQKDKQKFISVLLLDWCQKNGFEAKLKLPNVYSNNKTALCIKQKLLYEKILVTDFETTAYDPKIQFKPNDVVRLFDFDNIYHQKKNISTPVKNTLNKIKQNWNIDIIAEECSVSDAKEILKKVGNDIIHEARKHPLYSYLFDNTEKNVYEIQNLLMTTSRYENGRAFVSPPVGAIIKKIDSVLKLEIGKNPMYTAEEYMLICGKLAQKASENGDHIINDRYIKQVKSELEYVEHYDDIIKAIKKSRWMSVARKKNKTIDFRIIKFSIKQYRLIFAGLGTAMEYKSLENDKNINTLIDKILNSLFQMIDNIHIDHTKWEFDTIVVYSAALISKLQETLKLTLLERLCEISDDFSVEIRPHQEAAIYILSYILCEQINLPDDLRTKIFIKSYSQTIYRLQKQEWEYVSQDPFFVEYARSKVEESCRVKNGFAQAQPYFIFLYNYFHREEDNQENASIFLKEACSLRFATWFEKKEDKDIEDIVGKSLTLLLEAFEKMKNNHSEKILYYVYGANMVLYALSNFNEKYSLPQIISIYERQIFKKISQREILESVIITDYYTRFYNELYNISCDSKDMFLICGAFRIVSSYEFNLTEKISLLSMKGKYIHWYNSELPRYKLLLTRILAYTDFFDDHRVIKPCVNDFKGVQFLWYDNIDSNKISGFLEKPQKLQKRNFDSNF